MPQRFGPPHETVLLEAEALRRAILSHTRIATIATDASGVVQIFSGGAEAMLGYRALEVLNKFTLRELAHADALARVDDRDGAANGLDDGDGAHDGPDDGGEAGDGGATAAALAGRLLGDAARSRQTFALALRHKDGRRMPALLSATALHDAEGATLGYLLIGADRAATDPDLAAPAEQAATPAISSRSLIDGFADALVITDLAGLIVDINPALEALTGETRARLIGSRLDRCFIEPRRARAAVRRVQKRGKLSGVELGVRTPTGRVTQVSFDATLYRDRDGNPAGIFAAARDLSGRKQVEADLREARAAIESASRSKAEFLATMSHEIRTPMNAIIGIAGLLAKTPLTPEQDRYLQLFGRASDSLLHVIDEMLDLSALEASELDLEHSVFTLSELMDETLSIMRAKAQQKTLALDSAIAGDVPLRLVGDAPRIRQVLLNLLSNAIRFTASGSVSLRVACGGLTEGKETLRFQVADTGIGIARDRLHGLFENRSEIYAAATRKIGGPRLGLKVSKRLVELMGGRIWVDSTQGQGSVFSFSLPFSVADARRPAWQTVAGLRPLEILLVEDSSDNRMILLAYLQDTPYRVEVAENGAAAVERFVAKPFDLVLMDRQMPVMDGLAATRKIRAWEQQQGAAAVPIIALTAAALAGDRAQCLEAGCTGYLTKPIKQEALLQAIRKYTIRDAVQDAPPSIWRDDQTDRISARFKGLVPVYLSNRREDVADMDRALEAGDLARVAFLAHRMRGSGGMFGFQPITDIGAALEQVAESGDAAAARAWIEALSRFLDQVAVHNG